MANMASSKALNMRHRPGPVTPPSIAAVSRRPITTWRFLSRRQKAGLGVRFIVLEYDLGIRHGEMLVRVRAVKA